MANREIVETVRGKRGPVEVLKESGGVFGSPKYYARDPQSGQMKGPFSDYRGAYAAAEKMAE